MNNIIEIRNLYKRYKDFSLSDVTFDVPEGYITGFIGSNGAGKTTTIKCILNMINYDSGNVSLFGLDNRKNMPKINDQIGVVMDTPFYADDWTPADVQSALCPFYKRWDKDKFANLIKSFGIENKLTIKQMSRSAKLKLTLAAALSHEAKLLILDEPTSGLDPIMRDELCELLLDFVSDEKRSVLLSTHIMTDLEKIADYITFIRNGKIISTGKKDDLIDRYLTVKGGIGEITIEQKKLIIGLREYATGFEGLLEKSDIDKLSNTLLFEQPTLEEIIVYYNKGAINE